MSERDYLTEAIKILKGETMMLAQFEHLEAMACEVRRNTGYYPHELGLQRCVHCLHLIAIKRIKDGICHLCLMKEILNQVVNSDRDIGIGTREQEQEEDNE
jgi:hypothetical protein